MEENSAVHICSCGKTFRQRSGLFKHSKKCGQAEKFSPLSRKPCKELNCQYTYRYIEELRKHLAKAHNFRIVCETLMFESYEDFLVWKEEYETKTVSSFTRNNIKNKLKKGGRSTEYYYCHRSGQYKCMSKGKRRLKAQGSLKINNNCTAALRVTSLPNDSIQVFVCHTHYGHKMELCHVKISKRDRELLASQLSLGIPKEKILHTLSPSNAVTLERKHLIMRKDLNNISRAFGVKKIKREKQYRLNVDDFFEEVTRDGTATVLIYKKRKEHSFILPEGGECPLCVQDFAFGFMNQFQKEVFIEYGSGVLCFDVTSEISVDVLTQNDMAQYDALKIFSVLVIDEYGDGIPAAWLISNRDDSLIITLFFQQIKELVGSIMPKAIVTDRSSEFYQCWVNVFEGEPEKLLCSWHVYNEWRDKISQIEDQDAASLCYQVLCLLLEEQEMAKFVVLMQRCIKEMNENMALVEFGKYFCNEWAVIQEQWATCFRSDLGVDTNFHVETIHHVLKNQFIQEKFRKSPNKCLNLVLNFSSDVNMKRHEKHELEKTKIVEYHRIISTMSLDMVKQVSHNTWYVTSDENVCSSTDTSSGSSYSLVYVVEEINESCSRICNIRCAYCQVCMHLYKCSCSDSKTGTDICEHAHLVSFSKLRNVLPEMEDGRIILEEVPDAVDFGMLDHNYFEVAPQDKQHSSQMPKETGKECSGSQGDESSNSVNVLPVPNQNISIVSADPQKCLGVYTFPKPEPVPPVQIITDRRLGVPILPKPPAIPPNPTATLLGIILIPDSSKKSDPSLEDLKNNLIQNLDAIITKVKSCTNVNTLTALQSHINAAKSTLESSSAKNLSEISKN